LLSAITDAGPPMQPAGTWSLDAGENNCVLQHKFSAGGQAWSVGILPHLGLARTELLLIHPAAAAGSEAGAKALVTLRPSGTMFDGEVRTFALPDGASMHRIAVDNAVLGALPAAAELDIAIKHRPPIALPLPGMAGAAAALKRCEEQLLQSWGVDPARFRPLVPPGQPGFIDMSPFMSADDYPKAADQASGRAIALLALGADGKVADCRLVESSGNAALDGRTCQIALSRLRYPPAHDATGKPVTSWTMLAIMWTAPRL
jgi:hypothetical protein